MTNKEKLTSLKFAYGAVRFMHGSVVGDGEDHRIDPTLCKCEYGDAMRGLREMIAELRAARKQEKENSKKDKR